MFFCKKNPHCYFLFLFFDIWEETEANQLDDLYCLQCTILVYVLHFVKISSKINIFVTTASFRHFVSFSSKMKSFGAYV